MAEWGVERLREETAKRLLYFSESEYCLLLDGYNVFLPRIIVMEYIDL